MRFATRTEALLVAQRCADLSGVPRDVECRSPEHRHDLGTKHVIERDPCACTTGPFVISEPFGLYSYLRTGRVRVLQAPGHRRYGWHEPNTVRSEGWCRWHGRFEFDLEKWPSREPDPEAAHTCPGCAENERENDLRTESAGGPTEIGVSATRAYVREFILDDGEVGRR